MRESTVCAHPLNIHERKFSLHWQEDKCFREREMQKSWTTAIRIQTARLVEIRSG